MRSELFWGFTQHRMVLSYQHVGTNHFKGQAVQKCQEHLGRQFI